LQAATHIAEAAYFVAKRHMDINGSVLLRSFPGKFRSAGKICRRGGGGYFIALAFFRRGIIGVLFGHLFKNLNHFGVDLFLINKSSNYVILLLHQFLARFDGAHCVVAVRPEGQRGK